MAKERMISRTVTITTAEVLTVEVSTRETFTQVFQVTGSFSNTADLLAYLQQNCATEGFVIVAILKSEEAEKLYAMPESLFVRMAKELAPRAKVE